MTHVLNTKYTSQIIRYKLRESKTHNINFQR